jgi:hypothetical protein
MLFLSGVVRNPFLTTLTGLVSGRKGFLPALSQGVFVGATE